MGDRLTIQETRERYDGEWVLLTEMVENVGGETTSGIVAAHDPDRDAIYAAASRLKTPRRFETLCLREMPEGWGLAL